MYFGDLKIGDRFIIKGGSYITAIKTGPAVAVNVDNDHHLTLSYYVPVYKVKPTVKYNCPDCGLKVDDCTGCPRCKDVK